MVREIVHQYLCESVGFKVIAKRLRARGLASRRQNDKGKRRSLGWSYTSVRALLVNPIFTGRMRYNARRMHLDRRTGRRIPKFRETQQHLERQDESLRIISDEMFVQVQARMKKRTVVAPRGHRGIAPLSGLVYCQCGARCHSVKSANAKGSYRYYLCSRKMRIDECEYGGRRVREDAVLGIIQDRFAGVFKHRDKIIARAMEIASEAVNDNRGEADRIKGDLAEVEQEQSGLVELLMDRAIADSAKQAISRKLAQIEDRRNLLLAATDGLREQATTDLEGLMQAVRDAFDQARESLASAATPEQFNRLVDEFVGPMVIQPDGSIAPKEIALVEDQSHLQSCIAEGGFEPPTSGL